MNGDVWLLPLVLSTSLLAAVIIFLLPENRHGLRGAANLLAATAKLGLVIFMILEVARQKFYETRFAVVEGVDFLLRTDALALLFAGLSSLLWLCTTVYAIGYMENAPNRSRFFGFFSLCVTSTMGVALAGNLFTFLLFYEMLTLSTYPLVVHRGTEAALRAGRVYLAYTLSGGVLLLAGVAALYSVTGNIEFAQTGLMHNVSPGLHGPLTWIFVILIAGLAVKTAMFPLHGWLPEAMIAPAPVSALLHAVAVVKAGAFGIVRVIYDVYGIEFTWELGLLTPLAVLAAFTIIYGSLRALSQNDLKRRLAFSTVSQVSYIVLGTSLFGPLGTVGGLVHLLHQGIMKITLFFCAGNYAETLGIHKVHELNGVGRRMPGTSLAFTLGAFGMIGVPPMAGFISKWYLGLGAINSEMGWIVVVLVASSLLNAAYFLPPLYRIWFGTQQESWPHERVLGRWDTSLWLLLPTLATAAMSLGAGLLAGLEWSPLAWSKLIVIREYLP